MRRADNKNGGANELDPAIWCPRSEACRILSTSKQTILRWKDPVSFRMVSKREPGGRLRWYVHVADVERKRLERLGPTLHEVEKFVVYELRRGQRPDQIIESDLHRVTLGDVERIRDHAARLAGGVWIDPDTSSELRALLSTDAITPAVLLAHVRSMVARIESMTARLTGARAKSPTEPTNGSNE